MVGAAARSPENTRTQLRRCTGFFLGIPGDDGGSRGDHVTTVTRARRPIRIVMAATPCRALKMGLQGDHGTGIFEAVAWEFFCVLPYCAGDVNAGRHTQMKYRNPCLHRHRIRRRRSARAGTWTAQAAGRAPHPQFPPMCDVVHVSGVFTTALDPRRQRRVVDCKIPGRDKRKEAGSGA